jgi:hypothetical protein
MAMARWTFFSLSAVIVIGAVGQLALVACGTPSRRGFLYSEGAIGASGDSIASSGAVGDDATVPSSGASSAGGSGGAGASGSSSGNGPTSGQSSGASTSPDGGYVVRNCGSTPCDLRSKTCCLPVDGGLDASYCVGGSMTACGTNTATYHCLSAPDCPMSGNVCCGVYDLNALTATTLCQQSNCSGVQFCTVDSECRGNVKCVSQSCLGVSPLYLCGLQSQAPYSCKAN